MPRRKYSKAELLEMRRKLSAASLAEVQAPAVIDTFPLFLISPIGDNRCCEACRGRKGMLVKTAGCTLAMLPPFADCTNDEHGCRCAFIPISKFQAAREGLSAD